MSIRQTFPDVLHLGGGRFKIITEDGLSWVHHNTTIKTRNIPRNIQINGDSVVHDMEDEGLIVRQVK